MFRSTQFRLGPVFSSVASVLMALCGVSAALAQMPSVSPVANRVSGRIDESDVVTLQGNVHPMARAEFDRGEVVPETPLARMVLVLAPSEAQQAELDALTEAQQDPDSPLYHQWLTPAEYGTRFGVSPADLARITSWLQSHGFAVEPVSPGHRVVIFSGTAGQVADTFHTAMHSYAVGGQMHLANAQDPQIPAALAPVVSGVLSLHDFRRQSQMRPGRSIARPSVAQPENTQGSAHYLFPADYATIYNLNPLYTAGKNGAGATIAIVGRSNINLSDVSGFRSTSGLVANQPAVVLEGANPGLVSGDQDESTLDVEWAGAVAPNAALSFVVAASTATTDGVDLSAQYIVNHKTATVMSTSYGSCEAAMGSAENAFYNSLWQQAASEGISSFVSAGDSGAAGCNSGSASSGSVAGVNGLCSSPYSTCVGGTEFNEGSTSYWSTTNGAGNNSALSYIPEKVWNESASDGGSGLWSGGGGVSEIYTQPSWQKGVSGANSNGMRAVPDVSLTAASHDGYLIEENGSWYVVGGTSAASPSFAGIMALVNQADGSQGNANPTLYGLLAASSDPFHATPTGNNSVPGVTGFTASGASYNLATGLGSVNAATLLSVWPAPGTPVVQNGFTLKTSASSESLLPGKTATFTITAAATGSFASAITLKAMAPAGVTVSLSTTSIKSGGSATATITVSAAAAASTGSITITGTSSGITQTATVAMTVLAKPTLTLSLGSAKVAVAQTLSGAIQVTTTTGGSYSGPVALSVAGLPAGVTATWSSASYTPSADGSVVSTLTLKPTATAVLTTSSLTITATGDSLKASATASLQVTAAPALAVALSPAQLSMTSMGTGSLTVTASSVGGVTLTSSASTAVFKITGLPAGITGSWSTATVSSSGALQATLKLTGSTSALATSTQPTIAVTAADSVSGKSYTASKTLSLNVSHVAATLAVAPAATKLSVVAGQKTTVQVTTTTGGSFAGTVALSVPALPSGVTASWSPASYTATASGAHTTTLTLTASTTAAAATSTVEILASGDGVSGQSAVSLQVTPAPAISVAPSATQLSMTSMGTASLTVTVSPVGGVSLASSASAAAFKITGLPAGITAAWGTPAVTAAGALQAKLTLTGGTSALGTSTQPILSVSAPDSTTAKVYSATKTVALTVSHVLPTLTVAAAAAKLSLVAGQSATLQVTATTGGSFAGTVALSTSTLPSGVSASWSPATFPSASAGAHVATLTLKASASATIATGSLQLTATGDGITGQSTITLQVAPAPAVMVALSSSQINMASTGTQKITVTTTPVGGVSLTSSAASANFQITGLPVGIAASWGTPVVTAAGMLQSTLTLTGSSTAVTTSTKPAVSVSVAAGGATYSATTQATLNVTHSLLSTPRS
jgi:pseudomonalisin